MVEMKGETSWKRRTNGRREIWEATDTEKMKKTIGHPQSCRKREKGVSRKTSSRLSPKSEPRNRDRANE